ncbi:MAG: hypothetical protein Q7S65_01305 [Nanoarchaeota archaeon]|nr:hypothetical protein [Nanoarchaeota archaeon]
MTDLVAWVSNDSAEMKHVSRVVEGGEWEHVFLLTTAEVKHPLPSGEKVRVVTFDGAKPMPELVKDLRKALEGNLDIFETSVNLIAGSGKQHSVLLSALLQMGCGVRIVAYTAEGVREL